MSLSASNLGYMMSHDDNRAAKMATYQALLQAEATTSILDSISGLQQANMEKELAYRDWETDRKSVV